MNFTICRQQSRSLALRMTPDGPEMLVPQHIEPESETVQRFIEEALAKLPEPEPVGQHFHDRHADPGRRNPESAARLS